MTSLPPLYVVKGKAGLCNRLLCAIGSAVYAKDHRYDLYVDWSDQGFSTGRQTSNRDNFFPLFFQRPRLPEARFQEALNQTQGVFPATWAGNLQLSFDELMIQCGDDDDELPMSAKYSADFHHEPANATTIIHSGYGDELYRQRNYSLRRVGVNDYLFPERQIGDAFRRFFTLADPIIEQLQGFKSKKFTSPMIGVHVRYSDMKNPYGKYFPFIAKVLARQPEARIFLATDNAAVEQEFQQRYPGRIVSTEKWFPEPGRPIHRVRANPDRIASTTAALLDVLLLASCDYLCINSRSSFSYTAKAIAALPPDRIHDSSPIQTRKIGKLMAYSLLGLSRTG